jgi:nucleotide-binding universal stress UspA family protein
MHKVLIPLDGSETSQQILAVVRRFLHPTDVELMLLRVIPPFIDPFSDVYVSSPAMPITDTHRWHTQDPRAEWEAYQQRVRVELDAEAALLRQAGYAVTVDVVAGSPVEEIVRYVHEKQIDLIAMATHGRKGLSKLLMGSVAEEVLRSACVPLLLERPTTLYGSQHVQKPPLYAVKHG